MAAFDGDGLYVAGGSNDGIDPRYATLFKHDSVLNTWIRLEDTPTARQELALVHVNISSRAYLDALGGWDGINKLNVVEAFNIGTGHWEALGESAGQMNFKRASLGATLMGGDLYAMGGCCKPDGGLYYSTAERLRLSNVSHAVEGDGWQPIASMINKRFSANLVTVQIPVY